MNISKTVWIKNSRNGSVCTFLKVYCMLIDTFHIKLYYVLMFFIKVVAFINKITLIVCKRIFGALIFKDTIPFTIASARLAFFHKLIANNAVYSFFSNKKSAIV